MGGPVHSTARVGHIDDLSTQRQASRLHAGRPADAGVSVTAISVCAKISVRVRARVLSVTRRATDGRGAVRLARAGGSRYVLHVVLVRLDQCTVSS